MILTAEIGVKLAKKKGNILEEEKKFELKKFDSQGNY